MAFLQATRELTQRDLFNLSNVVEGIKEDPEGVNRLLRAAKMEPADKISVRALQLVALAEAVGPDELIIAYERDTKVRNVIPLVAAAIKGVTVLGALFKGGKKNKAEMKAMADAFLLEEKKKREAAEQKKKMQRLAATTDKKSNVLKRGAWI